MAGFIRAQKPVLWSIVEQTALAEAEVEYHDHRSNTVWVRFPIVHPSEAALAGATVVIWTTTPWTLPGNRAIAYSAELEYAVIQVDAVAEKSRAIPYRGAHDPGEKLVVALPLIDELCEKALIERHTVLHVRRARHCAHRQRSAVIRWPARATISRCRYCPRISSRPIRAPASVHIAPGHGADDWELGQANWPCSARDGRDVDVVYLPGCADLCRACRHYRPDGKPGDADPCGHRGGRGGRRPRGARHPCSFLTRIAGARRRQSPIFRNTPQWFISMSANGLRGEGVGGDRGDKLDPAAGGQKLGIHSMIES